MMVSILSRSWAFSVPSFSFWRILSTSSSTAMASCALLKSPPVSLSRVESVTSIPFWAATLATRAAVPQMGWSGTSVVILFRKCSGPRLVSSPCASVHQQFLMRGAIVVNSPLLNLVNHSCEVLQPLRYSGSRELNRSSIYCLLPIIFVVLLPSWKESRRASLISCSSDSATPER